jgi:rhamnogalacturonyl hydrolase YesR
MDPTVIAQPALWAKEGPMGLVAMALFVALFFLLKQHRDERREMREESDARIAQMLAVQRETNLVIQNLTAALERQNERWRRADLDLLRAQGETDAAG